MNPSADNGCCIKPEVNCIEDDSSREQQEVDRAGENGFQASRQADEHMGGWQAGTGLVILGQGEHRDLTRKKHKSYLAIQTFTSAEIGLYQCS